MIGMNYLEKVQTIKDIASYLSNKVMATVFISEAVDFEIPMNGCYFIKFHDTKYNIQFVYKLTINLENIKTEDLDKALDAYKDYIYKQFFF